jgi:hypothetical protein
MLLHAFPVSQPPETTHPEIVGQNQSAPEFTFVLMNHSLKNSQTPMHQF